MPVMVSIFRQHEPAIAILLLDLLYGSYPRPDITIQDAHPDDGNVRDQMTTAILMGDDEHHLRPLLRDDDHTPVVMAYLPRCFGKKHQITEELGIMAAENLTLGLRLLQILVEAESGPQILTPAVIKAPAANPISGHKTISWVLLTHPEIPCVSEDILEAAAGNPHSILHEFRGYPFYSCDKAAPVEELLAILLAKGRASVEITTKVLIAAVKNKEHGERYLRLLLDHPRRAQVDLQRVAAIAAGQSYRSAASMLRVLFVNGATIDEEILVAVVGNPERGPELISSFPSEFFEQCSSLSERLVTTAIDNSERGAEILETLLELYEGPIAVGRQDLDRAALLLPEELLTVLHCRAGPWSA